MTPTRIHIPDISEALNEGLRKVDELRSRVEGGKHTSVTMRGVLDDISRTTGISLGESGDTNSKTSGGVNRMVAADAAAASRAASVTTPQLGQQVAGQMVAQRQMLAAAQVAQQQAMQMARMAPQMMSPQMVAPQMSQPAMTSRFPAGSIVLSAQQMQQLAAALGTGRSNPLSAIAGKTPWNGSTKPAPISVNDVVYQKTVGKMSDAQLDAAIDSAMEKTGVEEHARPKMKALLKFMAHHESGNNASAVNTTDSNAVGPTQVDGAPAQSSRGLWQTIPGTFAAYHANGTSNNIYDPEASAAAAINYMTDRYKIGKDGSGIDAFYARRAGGYVGY